MLGIPLIGPVEPNPCRGFVPRLASRPVWLLVCAGGLAACSPAPRDTPNIILIVADTLRADHVGSYGYGRDTTPHLDALASQAIVFLNAYAQAPCTTPSMWNILTSSYHSPMPADDADTTIAEYLRAKGYRTAAFLAQHQLEIGASNLGQGFDVYDQQAGRDRHGLSTRTAGSVVDAAIDWIHTSRRPYFAWLVVYDPHDPYHPPREFQGYYTSGEVFPRDRRAESLHGFRNEPIADAEREFLIAAYDEEVRYLDHELGRLIASLKSTGEYDDALIVVTSDHGELLGDHGNRWDHCQTLSQEEIRVPLIMKLPGTNRGETRDAAVQHIDIYPTVVEYLDGAQPPGFHADLEGTSLLPLVDRRQDAGDRYAAAFWHEQQVLVQGRYKLWIRGNAETLTDMTTGRDADAATVRRAMKERLEGLYRRHFTENQDYEAIIRRLTALGYIHE